MLFAVLLFANLGFGQWEFGARLGANFSTISVANAWNDVDHRWIPGRVLGAVVVYNINDDFSVVSEMLHITSGAKFNYNYYPDESRSSDATNAHWKEIYSNIQIPILAKFKFGETYQFYGVLGPYFNYNLGGRYKNVWPDNELKGKIRFGDSPDNYSGYDWYLNKDYYRRFDVGMYIGAGVQRKLGPGNLAIDLRFGLGFLDTNKSANPNTQNEGYKPYKNRNISISAAYTFPVNKSK